MSKLVNIMILAKMILLVPMLTFSQTVAIDINDFAWLRGDWQRESSKSITKESWRRVSETALEGSSSRVSKASGETIFGESLLLTKMGGDIFYIAKVAENALPIPFKLVNFSETEAVFENPVHDFPQRIRYRRDGENAFTAIVEKSETSAEMQQRIEFSFEKINPQTFPEKEQSMKKATGIGGIFFKCESPEKMREWYAEHLGLVTNEYGSMFEFRTAENPDKIAYLQWSPFSQNTKYFEPSQKQFMINYRVENIEKLVEELRAAGVEICDEIETFDYGKFVHIMDPEGNKLELWEPVDDAFTEQNESESSD